MASPIPFYPCDDFYNAQLRVPTSNLTISYGDDYEKAELSGGWFTAVLDVAFQRLYCQTSSTDEGTPPPFANRIPRKWKRLSACQLEILNQLIQSANFNSFVQQYIQGVDVQSLATDLISYQAWQYAEERAEILYKEYRMIRASLSCKIKEQWDKLYTLSKSYASGGNSSAQSVYDLMNDCFDYLFNNNFGRCELNSEQVEQLKARILELELEKIEMKASLAANSSNSED
jgi:hypothetical protein